MEKLLNVTQLCQHLQVSKSLVYKWIHYDYIPHIKLGSIIRFREPDIYRWIERKKKRGRQKLKLMVTDDL